MEVMLRARFHDARTDGGTDGRTDGHGDSSISPQTSFVGGGVMTYNKTLHTNATLDT